MKKKMIFKEQDCDHSLLALINALFLNFPEYETSIVFSDMESNNVYIDEFSAEFLLSYAGGGTISDV